MLKSSSKMQWTDIVNSVQDLENLKNTNIINYVNQRNLKSIDLRKYGIYLNESGIIYSVLDKFGNLISLEKRKINTNKNKFEVLGKKTIWGLNYLDYIKNDNLIIVEGILDAIAIKEKLFINNVVALRTNYFNNSNERILFQLKNKFKNIYLAFDNDLPGKDAEILALEKYPFLQKFNFDLKEKDFWEELMEE